MIEFLNRGGWVMYVILFCSITALGIILERILFFYRTSVDYNRFIESVKNMDKHLSENKAVGFFTGGASCLHAIYGDFYNSRGLSREERDDLLHKRGSRQIRLMERGLPVLSAIGQLAPLLGLLGTVLGMITCFRDISNLGGHADAAVLAGGIWEALLTTAFGLIVAIPVIGIYHYFESIIDRRSDEMQYLVAELYLIYSDGNIFGNETGFKTE